MGEGLFREEALRHHTGGRAYGDILRLPPAWTRYTFAFLVAAFGVSLVYAAWGTVSIHALGLATASGERGVVTAFLPDRERAGLLPGNPTRLVRPDEPGRPIRGTIASIDATPVTLAEALRAAGGAAWPESPAPSRLAVVRVSLDAPSDLAPGEVLRIDTPVRRERLLSLLLPVLGGDRRAR